MRIRVRPVPWTTWPARGSAGMVNSSSLSTIEPQVQLAFPLEPQELIEPAPLQADRNLILAIDREAVANRCPAARAERHRFAHAFELNESSRNVVGLIGDRKLRIADCERADLACRREIALQQQRRHLQHVGDIVESVADVVGRQQLRNVDVEREQIANGVGVFGPVEAMERGAPGIGFDLRQAIALGLDSLDKRGVGGGVGPRHPRRRHLAAAQLAQHLFPSGAVLAEVGEVQRLQVQSGPRLGTEMAGVAIDLPGSPDRLLVKRLAMDGGGGNEMFLGHCRGGQQNSREYHAHRRQCPGASHWPLPATRKTTRKSYADAWLLASRSQAGRILKRPISSQILK